MCKTLNRETPKSWQNLIYTLHILVLLVDVGSGFENKPKSAVLFKNFNYFSHWKMPKNLKIDKQNFENP